MRIFLFITALMQFLSPLPISRAEAVAFADNKVVVDFPNTIDFSATISSEETIIYVEFIYGTDERTCSNVQATSLLPFTPSQKVNAKWQWDMRNSGSLPPGTQVWWQWKAMTMSGQTVYSDKQAMIWLDSVHPWQVLDGQSVRVHYYNINGQQAADLLNTALVAIQRLAADTGMTSSGTVDMFMYNSSQDLQNSVLYEAGWTGGIAFTEYNKIAIGMDLENMDWTKRTEAHELTHVLVGNYTFTCLFTTPTWLEEGLAVYGEGEPDANTRDTYTRAKAEDRLLSFNILSASFSEDPGKADISYSQSYYMVKYLIDSYGREKINALLKTLSGGTTVDDALKAVYGFDLAGFEKEWRVAEALPERVYYDGPTATPTEIPTMQPVHVNSTGPDETEGVTTTPGVDAVGETAETTPTAAPEEGSVPTEEPTLTAEPTATPAPATSPMEDWKFMFSVLLALICGIGAFLIIGAVVLFIYFRRNKKPVISALILLVLTASLAGTTKVSAASTADTTPTPAPTVYQTPSSSIGVYTNEESGVSIKIPSYVTIDTSKARPGFFFSFKLYDYFSGYLKSSGRTPGVTLSDSAHMVRTDELKGMMNISYIRDEATTLTDGTQAWLTVTDFQVPERTDKWIRSTMVTARGYMADISLIMGSLRENFDAYYNQVEQFNRALTISAPTIKGYSRDEILIASGGETDIESENDPATAHNSSGFDLVYSGLVTYDQNMNLTPDLASSWDVSNGGLTYTFHLRPEAVFQDMRPVTAGDVVYSWERAAAMATNSDSVLTYLGDIQGVHEERAGLSDHISGLTVIDDHTLQVKLEKPVPYFLLKLTYPCTFVIDKAMVESGDKWYLKPNGTGPFRLTQWVSRDYRLYERFDSFYGTKPNIKAILVQMYKGTSLQLYENGLVDFASVGGNNLSRFTDPSEPLSKELKTTVGMCTTFVSMDTTQPPFDDILVRQAFAMAVDKVKLARVIGRGNLIPAAGLYPPALPGYDKNLGGFQFDPERARALLQSSKYAGNPLPEIIISTSAYGNAVPEYVSALAQMWQDNLGVKITVQNINPQYYQASLDLGNHGHMFTDAWCGDYPDPENFADVLFHSGSNMNRTKYSNPDLDKLLEAARVEPDTAKRMEMYNQVEKIIVVDAPAIFIAHSKSYMLVKPYLNGFEPLPLSVPVERYLSIDKAAFGAGQP
jgi:oligopeptide transport system substrate-binding protein